MALPSRALCICIAAHRVPVGHPAEAKHHRGEDQDGEGVGQDLVDEVEFVDVRDRHVLGEGHGEAQLRLLDPRLEGLQFRNFVGMVHVA